MPTDVEVYELKEDERPDCEPNSRRLLHEFKVPDGGCVPASGDTVWIVPADAPPQVWVVRGRVHLISDAGPEPRALKPLTVWLYVSHPEDP